MRVLSVMRLLGVAEAVKLRLSRQAQRLVTAMAFGGVGLLVALFGLFFVSVAAMLGLATVWPMHWAALAIGGVLLLIAGILFFLAGGARAKPQQPTAASSAPPGGQNPELMEALHQAETLVRRNPAVVTLGAVALGVAVGLLSGRKKPDRDS